MKNIKRLIISISVPLLTGFLVFLIIPDMANIYNEFCKPALSPPGFIFPIVWTILYILIGIANYLVYDKIYGTSAETAYRLQLLLNLLWPIIFFGMNLWLAALIELVFLIITIIITIIEFGKIKRLTIVFLFPYLLWSLFAFYLNAGILFLN